MGRLDKMKRQAILEANQRNLGIITENPTGTTTSLQTKINLSTEESEKLEQEVYDLLLSIDKASEDKKDKKEMVDKLKYTLRTNKRLKRIVKRKQRELERELEKIERLENVDPETKKRTIKKLGILIGGVIIEGLAALYIDSRSDNPILPRIIDNLKNMVRRFTTGG